MAGKSVAVRRENCVRKRIMTGKSMREEKKERCRERGKYGEIGGRRIWEVFLKNTCLLRENL